MFSLSRSCHGDVSLWAFLTFALLTLADGAPRAADGGTSISLATAPMAIVANTTATASQPASPRMEYEPLPRDNGMVWPVLRDWTLEEEARYAEWIRNTVDENFYVRHRIVTDCADVPYSLRFIYARIRYLPQGVTDYRGNVFGNWDRGFANLGRHRDWAKDERFRRALERVLYDYTLVRSIPLDTYPIKVFPPDAMLHPGTVFTNELHSGIIWSIETTSHFPIKAIYSTLPPKIRELVVINFDESLTHRDIGEGLVNFCWWRKNPATGQYEIVPDEQMPGYSMEQYDHSTDLAMKLQKAWSKRGDNATVLQEMLNNLRSALDLRIGVVQEGYEEYRGRKGDRARDSYVYDCFSTPGRDARIRRKFEDIEVLAAQGVFTKQEFLDRMGHEKIRPIGLPEMSFLEYRHALEGNFVSPEPWDTPSRRWGINLAVRLEWTQDVARDADGILLGADGRTIVVMAQDSPVAVFTPEGRAISEGLAMDDPIYKKATFLRQRRRALSLREGTLFLPVGNETITADVDGRVAKLNAEAKPVWEKSLDSRLYAPPVAGRDGSIYITTENGFILALDPADGSTKWRTGLAERCIYPPVTGESGDIFQAGSGTVIALTAKGQARWRASIPGTIYSVPAVARDGSVYIGALDGNLHAISPDGKHLWAFPALSGVLVPPLVHPEDRVIFVSSAGKLCSLKKR